MNIIQIQKQLERLPDQTITGYVQNPNPEVPQYLALAELQRRQKLRAQRATQPQPSVADEMMSGIAGLPDTGVYNDKGYAAGGMVSFAEGGLADWNGMSEWDLWQKMLASQGKKAPSPTKIYSDAPAANPMGNGYEDVVTDPFERDYPRGSEQPQSLMNQGAPNFTSVRGGASTASIPMQPAMKQNAGLGGMATPNLVRGSSASVGMRGAPLVGGAGAPDLSYNPVVFDRKAYIDQLPATTTTAEKMKELREAFGPNTGDEQQRARLAKLDETAGKQAERAPWMALVNAGLAMAAGQSPNALTNIAAGGIEGLKSYTTTLNQQREGDEKRFGLAQQIESAKRDEQKAIAQYGFNSAEAQNAERRRGMLETMKLEQDTLVSNANNQFEAKKAVAAYTQKEREMAMRAAEAAADRDNALRVANVRASTGGVGAMGANKTQVKYLLDSYKARLASLKNAFRPEEVQEKAQLVDEIQALEAVLMQGVVPTGAAGVAKPTGLNYNIREIK